MHVLARKGGFTRIQFLAGHRLFIIVNMYNKISHSSTPKSYVSICFLYPQFVVERLRILRTLILNRSVPFDFWSHKELVVCFIKPRISRNRIKTTAHGRLLLTALFFRPLNVLLFRLRFFLCLRFISDIKPPSAIFVRATEAEKKLAYV